MENRIFYHKIPQIKLESLNYKEIFYDPPKKKKTTTFLENNKKHNIPLIIDYGSGITKAGWGNSQNPDLVFRTVVAKTKDSKNIETPVYVGNKLKEVDFLKYNYRSPFERNIIQHSGLLENINDYIFNELGVIDSEISHPLLVTECFANPEYCRINTIEQFFECYNVPSVSLGIDCLFSYYYNLNEDYEAYKKNTTLMISLGNSTIHIVPIINGQVQFMEIKRINVGGSNSYEIFQKNMNLKFNNQKNKFSLKVLQAAYENFNYVSDDYQDQLKYFKHGINAFENRSYINSIEYENNQIIMEEEMKNLISPIIFELTVPNNEPVPVINIEDNKKKAEMRKEQAQRLKETMIKRKEERKKQQETELQELEKIVEFKNKDLDINQFKPKMVFYALDSIEDVIKRIKKLKIKLGLISKETLEEEKMSLLNIPDDQLNAEQLKQKKMQYIFKQAAETRALKKQKQKELKEVIQHLKDTDPEGYIKKLYEKRNHILDKIEIKKREKIEINTRNSRFNQRRMQTLAHLGSDVNKNKKGVGMEDTFGINDEDWNVYRGISKEIGSDEENFEMKLNDIEIQLRELDNNYVSIKRPDESIYGLNTSSDCIELGVERVKGPEVLFQPKIGGIDQSGLSEVINQILKNYEEDVKKILLQNIFLTGGAALINNLKKRLEIDLKSSTPVGTIIKIHIAKDPIFDTWKGMKSFSSKHHLHDYCISREDYEEKGSTFFKENPFSNIVRFY